MRLLRVLIIGMFLSSFKSFRVVSSISHSIVSPTSSRPNEGSISISCDVPQSAGHAMSGAAYEPNRQGTEEVVFERLLDKALRRSEAVDKEGLCIVAGEKVSLTGSGLKELAWSRIRKLLDNSYTETKVFVLSKFRMYGKRRERRVLEKIDLEILFLKVSLSISVCLFLRKETLWSLIQPSKLLIADSQR